MLNKMYQNKHIEEYLTYYCNLSHAPEFAVLLKGKWGSGKTWFIQNFIKENTEKKFLYVSLYGLTSFAEIEDQFFKQLHPVLSSKGMALTGKVFKGLLKTTLKIDLDSDGKPDATIASQVPDIEIPEYLKDIGERILIFDDLERCCIETENVLGYINHFVEHQGMKCILIANEKEIYSKNEFYGTKEGDYKRTKEKLIGRTLEVLSDTDQAISTFIKSINNTQSKEHLSKNIELIKRLYACADFHNLRHLKQTMWDFERLAMAIPAPAINNDDFISHLITVLFSYSFEIKAGEILPSEIKKIKSSRYAFLEDEKKPNSNIEKLSNKYSEFDIIETLFGIDFWVDFFDLGTVDSQVIKESIPNTPYYRKESQPNWINLWRSIDYDDEQVIETLRLVEHELNSDQQQYDDIGIILHVVGLFLWLSRIGIYEKEKAEILSNAELILKEKVERGKIKATDSEIEEVLDEDFYKGLGFFGKDCDGFDDFCNFIKKTLKDYNESNLPEESEQLVNKMATDTKSFFLDLCYSNSNEGKYYKTPILTHIDTDKFLKKYFETPAPNRRKVFLMLKKRYEHDIFNRYLTDELPWLIDLNSKLEEIIKENPGKMSTYVIKNAVENHIAKSIKHLESISSNGQT